MSRSFKIILYNCGLYQFRRETFAPPSKTSYFQHGMSAPKKILVIRFSSLGDIILATPLLRVLHIRFPSSRIDFVVRKEYAELIRNNRNLSHLYEFDARTGMTGLHKLRHQLRAEHYDLVIDIHNSLRSRYLRWMLGVNKVVVFSKHLFARTILIRFKKNFYHRVISVADRYIEPVQQFGIENDGQGLELAIPEEIRAQTAVKMKSMEIQTGKRMIGFCPSAKHATKCWPQDRFKELGVKLSKELNATILLFGGMQDKEKCSAIAQGINLSGGEGSARDLSGELSILESAVAMEACDLIVTNDTGLMHVASAMKKKVVAIFGPTVREFGFFPVGKDQVVLERLNLSCRPCSHIGGTSCPEGHFRCMNEIQVEEVIRSIQAIAP
jgi:lipopolysaccharide heptosyltransferase II